MENVKSIEDIEFVWVDSISPFGKCKVCNFPEYRRKYMITQSLSGDSQADLWVTVTKKDGSPGFRNLGKYKTEDNAKQSAKEELSEVFNIVNCDKSWSYKAPIEEIGINSFNRDGIDLWIRNERGLNEAWLPKDKIREMRQYLQRIEEYINFYDTVNTPIY